MRLGFDAHDALGFVLLAEVDRDGRAGVARRAGAGDRLRPVNVTERGVRDGGNVDGAGHVFVADVQASLAARFQCAGDVLMRGKDRDLARGVELFEELDAQCALVFAQLVCERDGLRRCVDVGGKEAIGVTERQGGQRDRFAARGGQAQDRIGTERGRQIDEAQRRLRSQEQREDAEEAVRVVVAAHDDDRCERGELAQCLEPEAHVVDSRIVGVKHIAGVQDEVGPYVAHRGHDLVEDARMIGPARMRPGGQSDVPIGNVQQAHRQRALFGDRAART
jgi:hypothetical protein